MGQTINMQASSTGGSESGLATIDIPVDTFIDGVEWTCNTDLDTDNDSQTWQVSFASTVANTNDARGVISNVTVGSLTFTAGGSVIGVANRYTPMELPVAAGERIYLHSIAAAGVVGTARAVLHLRANEARASRRRV